VIEVVRHWVREHSPQAPHLEQTLAWTMELEPSASEELQIAALSHDMERAFPEGSPKWEADRGWSDPLYDIAHTERSARFVGDFLRDAGLPEEKVRQVIQLILAHETGGWNEADVVQAADSLSFLAGKLGYMDPLVQKVLAGKPPQERASDLVRGTKLRDVAFRKKLYSEGRSAVDAARDPMIELARLIDADARAVRKTIETQSEA